MVPHRPYNEKGIETAASAAMIRIHHMEEEATGICAGTGPEFNITLRLSGQPGTYPEPT